MYSIGPDDRVLAADDIPPPAGGPAHPRVMVDDDGAQLLYYVAEAWCDSHGLPEGNHVAICRFTGLGAVYFGAPNDEALSNHPLYERGLDFYGAFRVARSSWAAAVSDLGWRRAGTANVRRKFATGSL